MQYSSVLLALSAFAGFSSAQYTIDPTSVNITIRDSWCEAQLNTCPELCGSGGTIANTCTASTLNYTCTCRDGTTPNLDDYTQTIPYFECEQYISNCVAGNTSSAANQAECLKISCGDEVAGTSTTTSSSSSAAATTTSASSTTAAAASTTSASASAASTTAASGAEAIRFAREYGTPALMAAMLGAFGLAI